MAIPMLVQPGQIPAGTCPTSEQSRLNLYASLLQITFPLSAGIFNYGNTVPIPDQQSFPWIRLNSDGTLDGTYVYANGAWIRPHPIPASSPILYPFNGPASAIPAYDGGDPITTPISDDAGPMWQIATTDGNVPNSTNSNVIGYGQFLLGQSATYPQSGTGGSDTQILTLNQIPPHTHGPLTGTGSAFSMRGGSGGSSIQGSGDAVDAATTGTSGGNTDGTTSPINTLPPYLSVYFIQRTSRIFYRV